MKLQSFFLFFPAIAIAVSIFTELRKEETVIYENIFRQQAFCFQVGGGGSSQGTACSLEDRLFKEIGTLPSSLRCYYYVVVSSIPPPGLYKLSKSSARNKIQEWTCGNLDLFS